MACTLLSFLWHGSVHAEVNHGTAAAVCHATRETRGGGRAQPCRPVVTLAELVGTPELDDDVLRLSALVRPVQSMEASSSALKLETPLRQKSLTGYRVARHA